LTVRPIDSLASQQLAALLTRSFEPDRGSGYVYARPGIGYSQATNST